MTVQKKRTPIPVRFDEETAEALRRWAEDEDRTVAAQLRHVLRGVIPVKFFTPKCPTSLSGSPDGCRCDPPSSDEPAWGAGFDVVLDSDEGTS